jgi:monofunctional biosynthetic peptidoglycan transglycosylase
VEQRRAEARKAGRPFAPEIRFVPLEQISPRLAEAVVLAEDASFFDHGPFDFREMQRALEKNVDRRRWVRGASTITQQLAKNLYLGTEKTLARKVKEAVLALKLERSLGKRRILALYLNVAEWGDGVFGAEAAAGARFGVPASALTTAQAAVLAAMLPAPRRADLARPSPWLRSRSRHVLDLLLEYGRIRPGEHAHASAELERILAGAALPGDEDAEPPEE